MIFYIPTQIIIKLIHLIITISVNFDLLGNFWKGKVDQRSRRRASLFKFPLAPLN